jgi:hypothetical protein
VVAAHGVYDDADGAPLNRADSAQVHLSGGLLGLFLLDLDRGSTGVVAAVRTGVMDLLGLVAVRARLEVRHGNGEVGAAVALAGV